MRKFFGSMDGRARALRKVQRPRTLAVALLAGALLAFGGCAGTVGTGYGTAYYTPNYGRYYSSYGYGGYPYWGSGPYVGSSIVIRGRSHRRHYGRHHFRGRHHRGGYHRGNRHRGSYRGRGGRGR